MAETGVLRVGVRRGATPRTAITVGVVVALVVAALPVAGPVAVAVAAVGGVTTELVTRGHLDAAVPVTAVDGTPDGRYVAFTSFAKGIVPEDDDGSLDVFVRDTTSGVVERVSVRSDTTSPPAIGSVSDVVITPDGRYVGMITSKALDAADTNGFADAYLHDRVTDTTTWLSEPELADQPDAATLALDVSDDGRWIALASGADNLVAARTAPAVYLVDRATVPATATRVSDADDGTAMSFSAASVAISGDGTVVAWQSRADNIHPDTNGFPNIYVRDLTAGTLDVGSRAPDGIPFPDAAPGLDLDHDGTSLVFCAGPSVNRDVWLRDLPARTTTRISEDPDGNGLAASVCPPVAISGDGGAVAFTTRAIGYFSDGTADQLWVRQVGSGDLRRLSVAADGGEPNGFSAPERVLTGGRGVVFRSAADDLVDAPAPDTSAIYGYVATVADESPPQWPVGATITADDIGSTFVALSWTAATDDVGVTGYDLRVDGTVVDSVGGDETSHTLTSLVPGTGYTFSVDARDAAGNVATGPSVIATTGSGSDPSLRVSTAAGGLADLTWDASSVAGLTGYRVFRGPEGGPLEALPDVVGPDVTTFQDDDLAAATAYRWRVDALDADGDPVPHTGEVTATTPALYLDVASWAGTLSREGHLVRGTDVTVVATGDPNRTVSAVVDVLDWYDAAGALRLDAPAVEPRTVSLTEDSAAPGSYVGTLLLVDGIARVESVLVTVDDGAGHTLPREATDPARDVTGSLVVDVVVADPADTAGDRLVADHPTLVGRQLRLTGVAGPYELDALAAGAGYTVRHLGGDGYEAAVSTGLSVRRGLATDLQQTPELSASLSVTLSGADGETPKGSVVIDDLTTGQPIGTRTLIGGVAEVVGLVAGHDVALRYASTSRSLHASGELAGTPVALALGRNEVVATVPLLPVGTVRGSVTSETGDPQPGRTVALNVRLPGTEQYRYLTTTTDADGLYSTTVPAGEVEVVVGDTSSTIGRAGPASLVADGELTLDVTVVSLVVATVEVELYTRYPGELRQGPVPMPWRSASSSGFHATDAHYASDIQGYPLRLLVGSTQKSVQICADGSGVGLPPGCGTATLDGDYHGVAVIELEADAGLRAQLVHPAGGPVGDRDVLVRRRMDDGGWEARRLPGHGDVLDVTLEYAGSYELDIVTADGATATVAATVVADEVADLGTIELAFPAGVGDDSGIGFGSDIGADAVEVRASVSALTGLSAGIVTVPRPHGATLAAGAVTVDGEPVVPTVGDDITVPIGDLEAGRTATVRIRLGLEKRGVIGTTLKVAAGGGEPMTVDIATVARGELSLRAPRTTASALVPVWGRAPARSTVAVLADGALLATAVADATGTYETAVALPDRGRWHTHDVWAQVSEGGEESRSSTSPVTVDPDHPVITRFSMTQPGREFSVDGDPRGSQPIFVVRPKPITFEIGFSDPSRVRDMVVSVGDTPVALSRVGDRFTGEAEFDWSEFGPIHLGYDIAVNGTEVMADPPTAEQAARLITESDTGFLFEDPPAVVTGGSVSPATVLPADMLLAQAEETASYTIHEEHDLGESGGTLDVEVTGRRTIYEVTTSDLARAAETGFDVYGLSVRRSALSSSRIDVGVTAFFPLAAVEAEMARTGLGQTQAAVSLLGAYTGPTVLLRPASAVAVVEGVEVTINVVLQGNDILGSIGGLSTVDELNAIRDAAGGCGGPSGPGLGARAERLVDEYIGNEALKLGMGAAGVGLSAAGVSAVLGIPLAIAGVAVGSMLDKDFKAKLDGLRADLQEAYAGGDCDDPPPADGDPGGEDPTDGDPIGVRWIFDPSGYTFEAVPDDRLQGVTATLFEGASDTGPWTVWDAVEYGQQNPQTTDGDGRYAWDVPEGWWQVVYELDGYERAYSDVLRVLPPQLDVNEGLRRLAGPLVDAVTVTGDTTAIDVRFDTWVRVDDITNANLDLLDGGASLDRSVSALDTRTTPDGLEVTRTARITPVGGLALGAELEVVVYDTVASYADRPMELTFRQSVTVAANRAPVADADAYVLDEDTTFAVGADLGVLAGDTDADGHLLTAMLVTGPAHGTATLDADGSLSYHPDADFSGTDTLTYVADDGWTTSAPATVTLTVRSGNDPTRVSDDRYDVRGSLAVPAGGVLANDRDDEGDELVALLVEGPLHGTIDLAGDGGFQYTATSGYAGADQFTYRVYDGSTYSRPATVDLVVAASSGGGGSVEPDTAPGDEPRFTDVVDNVHRDAIEALAAAGITLGCDPDGTRYCPELAISRGAIASLLARTLELPAASRDHFDDDTGNIHEDAINRAAEAGLVLGVSPGRFDPTGPLSRAQMASVLARALDLPRREVEGTFIDVTGVHAAAIEAIARHGVTRGCDADGPRYCPAAAVTRAQMASFLVRAFGVSAESSGEAVRA